jgi:hypothetical protein
MRKRFLNGKNVLITIISLTSLFIVSCSKNDPVNYAEGVFPDTVINLDGLNSLYDDYNTTTTQVTGALSLIFSSNRKSAGMQFDLEQGLITFTYNKIDGSFGLSSTMTQDQFIDKLITTAETPGNDFGPYSIFSAYDGYEYFILSSENAEGNLDLMYCKNVPVTGVILPAVDGPYPVKLLNTAFDDAYLSFNLNLDSAYFTSNIEGNFDIYSKTRPEGLEIARWFDSDYSPSSKVDSINSPEDDKCPMIYNKCMVFTSNRPGGYGGFDLYYSIFKNGKWNAPVNLGPKINSSFDEYRPLIGYFPNFKNNLLIFSSNRSGGKGGFDLYFTGFELPK